MGFPFPSTVGDWLSWVFCRFMQNGAQLPGEPNVNFLSPLVAVDNPSNRSIDISMTGGVLAWGGTISSSTYAMPANTSVAMNASLNSVAVSAPGTPTDGTRVQLYAIPQVSFESTGNTCSFTDTINPTNLVQNPIDLELYQTITWGDGSGGGANPNLPKGYCGTWQRTTVTVASVTTTYWQAVQGS